MCSVCTDYLWQTNLKCAESPMYGLSLLVTQRGLSPADNMAACSPTEPMPNHGKVGVKEGDMQRHIKNEKERGRGTVRGGEGVMTARGTVSSFSGLPPNHETSPPMTTAAPCNSCSHSQLTSEYSEYTCMSSNMVI